MNRFVARAQTARDRYGSSLATSLAASNHAPTPKSVVEVAVAAPGPALRAEL